MMNSKWLGIFGVSLALFVVPFVAQAQTASGAKCPPVKPKNAEEALRIEESSNKVGCWVRDKSTEAVYQNTE